MSKKTWALAAVALVAALVASLGIRIAVANTFAFDQHRVSIPVTDAVAAGGTTPDAHTGGRLDGVLTTPEVDAEALLARRDTWVSHYSDEGQVSWAEGAGLHVVRGHGRLVGEREVEVVGADRAVHRQVAGMDHEVGPSGPKYASLSAYLEAMLERLSEAEE